MKLLFVSTANVGRGVMAEHLFRKMISGTKYEGIVMCQSVGISPEIGKKYPENLIKILQEDGIEIRPQKSRKLSKEEFGVWDAYFVMTDTQGYILEKAGIEKSKIYVPQFNVGDLHKKSLDEYRLCKVQVQHELNIFFDKLKEHYSFKNADI